MFIKLSPFLIALLIGLLVGVDREKQRNARQAMGVRSYILFALVGALTGDVNEPFFTVGMLLFATAVTLFGYAKTSSNNSNDAFGLTSEIAAMATFGLGYLAHREPFMTLALGAIMLFVLHNKSLIHTFVRTHLRPEEIRGVSILFLLTVGVVPLIPDHTIDPLRIFNPHRLAVIIVVLASLQFGGYVAIRIFGSRIGLPLAGFFGGLASSTAVFISYPKLVDAEESNVNAIVAAAIFSMTGSLSLLFIVVGIISWQLIIGIIIPLGSIIIITAAIGIVLSLRNKTHAEQAVSQNPLNLMTAIKLGTFLTGLIFIIDLTERYLGSAFTNIVTFLGGLFELNGVVIATANMLENNAITLEASASTALIAIIASMVSKIFITGFMSSGRYRVIMLPIISGLFLVSAGFWVAMVLMPNIIIKV